MKMMWISKERAEQGLSDESTIKGIGVAGQDGGRKLGWIDGINTTIYYKKNSHSD